MARLASHRLFTAVVLASMLAGSAVAQSAPASSAPTGPLAPPRTKVEPAAAEPARPEAPRRRAISPEIAAQLMASTPKFEPLPPKPEPKPEAEQVDLREIDKPQNEIIRLPNYIVQEKRPPVFRERDINTEKGLTDIAMRRYISDIDQALNRFTIPFVGGSTEDRALAMYREEERLQNIREMRDAARTVSESDAAQGAYILRESRKTFMRSSDFGRPSANPAGLPQRAGP